MGTRTTAGSPSSSTSSGRSSWCPRSVASPLERSAHLGFVASTTVAVKVVAMPVQSSRRWRWRTRASATSTASAPSSCRTAQVHLRRLVRGEVPAIIALRCLAWYGAHRQPGDPNAAAITVLRELEQAWRHHPDQRADLEAQIRAIAVDVVGQHPTTLIDDPL